MVCLAGDLTSDGFAPFFWGPGGRKSHAEKFYRFLHVAGEKAKILIIRGNHDEDYAGDYSPERINAAPNCQEISGKIAYIDGYVFLGLGFREAWKLKDSPRYLQSLIHKYFGKINVILMHDRNVRYASLLKPKFIIKGGFSAGACRINDAPTIFTGPYTYAVIKMDGNRLLETEFFVNDGKQHRKVQADNPQFYRKFSWVKPLRA